MLYTLLFVASLSILSSFSEAEPLNVFSASLPAPTLPGYQASSNLAPAFHVWQNDPELAEYYVQQFADGTGITNLCVPSSLADLLLYQRSQRKPMLEHLIVPGMDNLAAVNGAAVVKAIISSCGLTPPVRGALDRSINWSNGADCLDKIYKDSGYAHSEIHYIRQSLAAAKQVNKDGRYPTLFDISDALKQGFEVVAVLSFQAQDPVTGLWKETSAHAVNVFGFSSNKATQDQSLVVYLQNSNRLYPMDFTHPVFDVALFTQNTGLSPVPEKSSSIEISTLQGRLLNFQGKRTFLSGLVLIKASE